MTRRTRHPVAEPWAVGTAVALRHPGALRRAGGPNWVSAAFAGVLTFAATSLLLGVAPEPDLVVAVLGWGLGAFGFVAGVAFEREHSTAA